MRTFLAAIINILCGAVIATCVVFLITQEDGWFIAQMVLFAIQMMLVGILYWDIRR